MAAAELTTALRAYGDAGGHWTGGSGTASVALPDGRVVWLFGGAGHADAVPNSYIARLKGEGAQRERINSWSEQLVAQAGGTLTSVFVSVLQGFAAELTESQAINLAAHPDILDV